ncbi:MAG: protein-(glutamine-N5) methyltransferase, release factor-specific [Spirochaetes bacterium GWD1_27_9]|nr:MAG: protein-(glutamine-N5) methyltransferase, release factor-specific [Spirochaetes bacterium GWB1_27_13]OHD28311.1 MAG: protein-(glutamine-N5) methyltransferase, release factor-specific [Spirochaetes bacterium GWC1_27_15]OHD29199.1 MAG: protein-(glutamine-N5) methyltransferase, release factor-specific [Spirochaetes bacterium GWD1_27_9]
MKINELYQQISLLLQKSFIDNPKNEAAILICFVLNIEKKDFILLQNERQLTNKQIKQVTKLAKERLKGRSIAELINKKDFYDLEFFVTKDVLIPRPETELLIELTLPLFKKDQEIDILEIGVGSGAISLVLATKFINAKIDAIDISKKALSITKINIIKNNIQIDKINLIKSDFFKFSPKKQYDLIISNPPYIPQKEVENLIKNKIVSDPKIALAGGKDGLVFYKKLKEFGLKFLKSSGFIVFEHGIGQREDIKNIFGNDFKIECFDDLAGIDRAFVIQK